MKCLSRPLLSLSLLLIGLLSGTGVQAQRVDTERPEVGVTTAALSELWIQAIQRVAAEVVALNHAQISSQANGEVLGLEVEVGDEVEKGDILVALDCRQSELSEAVLRDVLSLARKEYKRAESLQKSKTIAEQEIARLQSALEQARIRIQQADLAVEHCLIKAPFKGVVTRRQVQLGMIATVGSPMVELLQMDAVEVAASVDASALSSLQKSDEIVFSSAGRNYPLGIRAILPLLQTASNKRYLRLAFVAEKPFPGASGELEWQLSGRYLPTNLLVERQGQLGYFIVEKARAKFVALPKAILGHPASLGSASRSGTTQLVLEGRFKLKDGDRIMLREAKR